MLNEKMLERQFQEKIYNSKEIQSNILSALEITSDNSHFEREIEFVNGITSDFIIFDIINNKMQAIIECKQADIGVTEYVRGVGQLFQYEYFQKKHIRPKKYQAMHYDTSKNINALVIPSSFIKNTNLNIGLFNYPSSAKLLEVHIHNNRVREISVEEREKLSATAASNLHIISQYYVRDNRIFEYYIALRIIGLLKSLRLNISRRELEKLLVENVNVINNGNWRNVFITLSSLGIIQSGFNITPKESSLINAMNIYEFTKNMYKDYLYPYIDLILEILVENSNESRCELNNQDICNLIRERYGGKDVLFLTESNGRYISSWLNIMRDDLGCIDFRPRSSTRTINYIPKELKESELINKIQEYSSVMPYIEAFENRVNAICIELLSRHGNTNFNKEAR